jgi:hypothetical protein
VHAVMLEVDFAFQPEELRLNPNPSLRWLSCASQVITVEIGSSDHRSANKATSKKGIWGRKKLCQWVASSRDEIKQHGLSFSSQTPFSPDFLSSKQQ